MDMDFPGSSDGEETAYDARDLGSISGLGRSAEERNGSPPQYSCAEKSMDREAWRTTVHEVAKGWSD